MKSGGGGSLVHVYVWEHIVRLNYRIAWWILTELARNNVLMTPHTFIVFWAQSTQGWIQGGAQIGHRGPLLKRTSSLDRKTTATNQMHRNYLEACGKKCFYFSFHLEVKFLSRFWRIFGLMALVTPTDRPKSVRNRCLIELFCGVVCVVTLPFWHFCWCGGFCHRTESDLFLFLLVILVS